MLTAHLHCGSAACCAVLTAGRSQVAYAIGIAKPLSTYVNTYGTGTKTDAEILEIVHKNFDLRPFAIIKVGALFRCVTECPAYISECPVIHVHPRDRIQCPASFLHNRATRASILHTTPPAPD
jgi:hypothetical protein